MKPPTGTRGRKHHDHGDTTAATSPPVVHQADAVMIESSENTRSITVQLRNHRPQRALAFALFCAPFVDIDLAVDLARRLWRSGQSAADQDDVAPRQSKSLTSIRAGELLIQLSDASSKNAEHEGERQADARALRASPRPSG